MHVYGCVHGWVNKCNISSTCPSVHPCVRPFVYTYIHTQYFGVFRLIGISKKIKNNVWTDKQTERATDRPTNKPTRRQPTIPTTNTMKIIAFRNKVNYAPLHNRWKNYTEVVKIAFFFFFSLLKLY